MDETAQYVTYLLSVVHGAHPPEKLGQRNASELRTIAECLDALGRGDLPHLADMLAQRFKALELAAAEGNWDLARRLEITPVGGGLASMEERSDAVRSLLVDKKLREHQSKKG